MQFLTLNTKQFRLTGSYQSIRVPHVLITISTDLQIPNLPACKGVLQVDFDDISNGVVGNIFTSNTASEILDFINNHCNVIDLIVCVCPEGISRSTAVAAALSKIINNEDDNVFSKGMPNMFVYTTLLDTYFLSLETGRWKSVGYLREFGMRQTLDMTTYRIWKTQTEKGERK